MSISLSCQARTPSYVCAAMCACKWSPIPLASGALPRAVSMRTWHMEARLRRRRSVCDGVIDTRIPPSDVLASWHQAGAAWRASWGRERACFDRIDFITLWYRFDACARSSLAGHAALRSGRSGCCCRLRCRSELRRGCSGSWIEFWLSISRSRAPLCRTRFCNGRKYVCVSCEVI